MLIPNFKKRSLYAVNHHAAQEQTGPQGLNITYHYGMIVISRLGLHNTANYSQGIVLLIIHKTNLKNSSGFRRNARV
jgi:hypothetical protein